ncbi:hypothetical protein BGX28_001427 [Mortierella sp. GBA30]|nr:hypothetical protein BGX28_001427 [Mortierella sp. GBA30]
MCIPQPHCQIKHTIPQPQQTKSSASKLERASSPFRNRNKASPEDSSETNVDNGQLVTDGRASSAGRGTNGGHLFSHDVPSLPAPVSCHHSTHEGCHHPHSRHQGHQEEAFQLWNDDQIQMYRTGTFMGGLTYERKDPGDNEKQGNGFIAFQYNAEMESRIVRKFDKHLLPLLGVLYLFSFLDRVNIGNARLFGLEEAVHLSGGQYNIALASFFLAYCVFEMPSNWILVRVGPRTWIPILMVVWGAISLSLAWVTSFPTLIVARFALGTAEAGFVPGVLFYLTLFYKRSEHSLRISIFLCFNLLAGAFGGLLAALISKLSGKLGLQGWQWIFIVEAIPTILLALLAWVFMSPSPATASFLTDDEKVYATRRILMDTDFQTNSILRRS